MSVYMHVSTPETLNSMHNSILTSSFVMKILLKICIIKCYVYLRCMGKKLSFSTVFLLLIGCFIKLDLNYSK
jgi:hypothetical protein